MSSGKGKRNVRFDPSSDPPPSKGVDRPILRKAWYIVTAILFFVLVLVALISGSYIISFLNQNPTCALNPNTSVKVRNSAILLLSLSVACLVLVIGFAVLQVRKKHKPQRQARKEKRRQQKDEERRRREEEQERDDDETETDEDEGDEPEPEISKSSRSKPRSRSQNEPEQLPMAEPSPPLLAPPPNQDMDPKQVQQILQELTVPSSPPA